MRTSEQVAQFVALQRLGFDVELVPGEVLIEAWCASSRTPTVPTASRWSPSDAVLDPGDRILEVDGVEIATVDDLSGVLAGKRARRRGDDADRAARTRASSRSRSS